MRVMLNQILHTLDWLALPVKSNLKYTILCCLGIDHGGNKPITRIKGSWFVIKRAFGRCRCTHKHSNEWWAWKRRISPNAYFLEW